MNGANFAVSTRSGGRVFRFSHSRLLETREREKRVLQYDGDRRLETGEGNGEGERDRERVVCSRVSTRYQQ